MIRITDKSLCCGCSACQAICPHDAVVMRPDALGFLYPEVDGSACVDCGLCEKVCDFAGRQKTEAWPAADVYAARHKDMDTLKASQSGGVFTALSDVILNSDGTVYGAAFDENMSVRHSRACTAAQRDAFRGSKYVQSRMGHTFRSVLDDLKAGRKVLFVGTPCQTAGLRSFVPERHAGNLFLVDFVCHGVPSPAVWKAYVEDMGRYGRIEKADFRDKTVAGWKEHKESFTYADGSRRVRETFKVLFYKNIMLRSSCGSCTYDIRGRASDLVIADFWGVENICPQMDGEAGTSMVIALTEKGRTLLAEASGDLEMQAVDPDFKRIAMRNPNLLSATHIHPESKDFERAFAEKGFRYVASRWGDRGWRYKAWQLKCLLRKISGRS